MTNSNIIQIPTDISDLTVMRRILTILSTEITTVREKVNLQEKEIKNLNNIIKELNKS